MKIAITTIDPKIKNKIDSIPIVPCGIVAIIS